jgi:hypothetical protein
MKGMRIVQVAIGAGALILAGLSGASAQEEGVAVKSLLGSIGIIPKDRPPINYRERAPLVLPPKMELRAPVEQGSIESRVANWPKDPDVAAARAEAREARMSETQRQAYKLNKGDRLSIEEMRAGRRTGADVVAIDPATRDNRSDKSRMSPDELRAYSTTAANPKLDPNGIDRRFLSDPPQGLLRAAGNGQLKASSEPAQMGDPDSPQAYLRQRQQQQ